MGALFMCRTFCILEYVRQVLCKHLHLDPYLHTTLSLMFARDISRTIRLWWLNNKSFIMIAWNFYWFLLILKCLANFFSEKKSERNKRNHLDNGMRLKFHHSWNVSCGSFIKLLLLFNEILIAFEPSKLINSQELIVLCYKLTFFAFFTFFFETTNFGSLSRMLPICRFVIEWDFRFLTQFL